MKHDEANFQIGAVRMLKMAGYFCFAIPNGGSRNLREARNLKLQGVMAGVADIEIILPGPKIYFIEFKNPNGKGRQSINQAQFETDVLGYGCHYEIWDSWTQVEDFINGHRKEIQEDYKLGGTD